jgi:membrane protease YdiL (CAAX protease family)
MKKSNKKLLFLLIALCGITGLMAMPFTFALIELPTDAPMNTIILAQFFQILVLGAIAAFFGLILARSVGFSMPVLESISGGQKRTGYLKSIVGSSVFWGVLGGVLVILLCIPFWDISIEMLKREAAIPLWKSILVIFYGGITEEILFRLFLMSLFVWITTKIKKTADGFPTKFGIWFSIIITGILFGLGHLGVTHAMTEITSAVIVRAVMLNGSISILYGFLYWKKGLESAMIAHFCTDIVLHIILPQGVALL